MIVRLFFKQGFPSRIDLSQNGVIAFGSTHLAMAPIGRSGKWVILHLGLVAITPNVLLWARQLDSTSLAIIHERRPSAEFRRLKFMGSPNPSFKRTRLRRAA